MFNPRRFNQACFAYSVPRCGYVGHDEHKIRPPMGLCSIWFVFKIEMVLSTQAGMCRLMFGLHSYSFVLMSFRAARARNRTLGNISMDHREEKIN